jgi:undecaprenyl-phosphate 4-deoxy-4-formamido-L-arabinose transferase
MQTISDSLRQLTPLIPSNPLVSIVIPVYNEEDGLDQLFARLYTALDKLAIDLSVRYEVVFVNDGSRDLSAAKLAAQFEKRPDTTRSL